MERNEWFIEVPWGKIAVASWGSPRNEKVLLCHGRKDNLATFYPLMELMPNEYYYVAMDLPGCGLSDPFPGALPVHVMSFVPAVAAIVDSLEWYKFIFIGHSMGTVIGEIYNAVHPGRVTQLIQLDPDVSISRLFMPLQDYMNISVSYHYKNIENILNKDNGKRYTKEEAIKLLSTNRGISLSSAEGIASRNLVKCENGLYRFSWDVRMNAIPHLWTPPDYYVSLMTSHPVPTLCINASDRLDNMGYKLGFAKIPELTAKMASKIPIFINIKLTGGHDLHLNNTQIIVDNILVFMRKKHDLKAKL